MLKTSLLEKGNDDIRQRDVKQEGAGSNANMETIFRVEDRQLFT